MTYTDLSLKPILSRKAVKPSVISQTGMPEKRLWGTPAKKSLSGEGHSLSAEEITWVSWGNPDLL